MKAKTPASALRGQQFLIEIDDSNELIIADGALQETIAEASVFTQFPIGRGGVATDHKQTAPSFVSVDLFVTDTPTETPESNVPAGFQILSQPMSTQDGGTAEAKGPSDFLQRSKAVLERLIEINRDGSLLNITTSHRLYENMVLTRVEVPVDNSERSVIISCDFQQVFFASSRKEDVRVVSEPRLENRRSRGSREGSERNPEEPGRAQQAQVKQSILAAGRSAIGG